MTIEAPEFTTMIGMGSLQPIEPDRSERICAACDRCVASKRSRIALPNANRSRSSVVKIPCIKLALVAAVTVVGLLGPDGASAAALCYQTFDREGRLIYESRNAPADITNPNSESWARLRQRGEHVIWQPRERCGTAATAHRQSSGRATAPEGTGRLLLDRATPMVAGPIGHTVGAGQ